MFGDRRPAIGGAVLVMLAACGGDSTGNSAPPPDAITINLVSTPVPAFVPAVDTIAVGGTVTWQWDAGTHDVEFPAGASPVFPEVPDHTGVQAPQTVITAAGSYHFFCSWHATEACLPGAMCGTIVAK